MITYNDFRNALCEQSPLALLRLLAEAAKAEGEPDDIVVELETTVQELERLD